MRPQDVEYKVWHCKVHHITIHYLVKQDSISTETQCWDCIRDANNKKNSREAKLQLARKQFSEEFSHLWTPNVVGGIVAAKVDGNSINVSIETSADVLNQLPNEYRGFAVSKQIVGVQINE
jgi:hypothetical protein